MSDPRSPCNKPSSTAEDASCFRTGNTVIVIEHDMQVIASCDWIIDIGPGAGDEGGKIIAAGTPEEIAAAEGSKTAPYLAAYLSLVPGKA